MAFGDILEVQVDNNQGSSGTGLAVTLSGAPPENSLVLAIANAESSLPAGIDQAGFGKTLQYTDTGQEGCTYWKVAGASEGTTVSLDVDSATQDRTLVVVVIEGPFAASPLNDSNVNTKEAGGSGSSETGNITTTVADCLLLGVAYAGLAVSHVDCIVHPTSGGNSFTKITDGSTIGFGRGVSSAECRGIGSSTRVVSSTGTYSTRFSWVNSTPAEVACTENWGAIAAFEQASGGGTVTGSGAPAAQAVSTSGTAERELPGSGTPAAQAAAAAGTSSRGLDSTGTPTAQAAATSGAAERVLLCSGELISAASSVSGTAAIQVKLTLTSAVGRELRDENGAVVASLSNINFEWYDKDTDTEGDPDVSGTFNTDASGEATIQLAGSSLTAGQFGLLVLEHPTDNTIRGIYRIPVS